MDITVHIVSYRIRLNHTLKIYRENTIQKWKFIPK